MKPCCHLHIGTAKTGTTSIQSFLQLNRQRIAAQGYYFPHSLGESNHEKLVAYALNTSKVESKRRQFSILSPDDLKQFRSTTKTELGKELATLPKSIEHVILSNEHCHSRLTTLEELQTLKHLLESFFDNTRVIVYLRRQDQAALSLYNTRILSGSSSARVFPAVQPNLPLRFDYARCLALYAHVFGHENIIVRQYAPHRLDTHTLVQDFAQAIGLKTESNFKNPSRLNESLRHLDLQFLRIFNLAIEQGQISQPAVLRKCVITSLKKSVSSKIRPADFLDYLQLLKPITATMKERAAAGILERVQAIQDRRPINVKGLVTRHEAKQFYGHFRSGNVKVASQFLPDRTGSLFEETFREYA